jgi:hypothetical protein
VLRQLARASVVLVMLGPALVLSASPCAACSCVPRTPEQLVRHADAAFVGEVIDQQVIDEVTTVQTFRVRSVFKGTLGPTVQMIAPLGSGGGSSCGILYGAGEVAVILHRLGDGWTTDVCSRITTAQLAGVAPSPVPPVPEPSGSSTPVVSVAPSGDASAGLGWQAVVLGLFVGVAAIALALSLGGRRDRASVPPLGDPAEPPEERPADPTGPNG